MSSATSLILLLVGGIALQPGSARPSEQERVQLWYQNGNTWPPNWQPETEKMKRFYAQREREVMAIPGANERWENWLQFTQGRMVPKFTEVGFEVVQTPPEVQAKLAAAVSKAVDDWENVRSEGNIDVIYNQHGSEPKFVDIGGLAWETAEAMKSIHEQWGGVKLVPRSAYGVRLYQNGSSLVMHYDKVQTHVISSIVHIAHEYDDDDEPWPIQIEDHEGNLHSVSLQPGQMLFYESAKCLHGRMKKFRGKYYGSIFVHYQPVDKSIWNYTVDDIIANVPPHWNANTTEPRGSRWAGAAMTISSRVTEDAPDRTVAGSVVEATNRNQFYTPFMHNEL